MMTTNGIRLELIGTRPISLVFVKGHVRVFINQEGHGDVGHGYFTNVEKALDYLQDRGYIK